MTRILRAVSSLSVLLLLCLLASSNAEAALVAGVALLAIGAGMAARVR